MISTSPVTKVQIRSASIPTMCYVSLSFFFLLIAASVIHSITFSSSSRLQHSCYLHHCRIHQWWRGCQRRLPVMRSSFQLLQCRNPAVVLKRDINNTGNLAVHFNNYGVRFTFTNLCILHIFIETDQAHVLFCRYMYALNFSTQQTGNFITDADFKSTVCVSVFLSIGQGHAQLILPESKLVQFSFIIAWKI